MQNVENRVLQNAVQNPGVQNGGNQNGIIVVPRIANQNVNQIKNGNVVATRAEGNIGGNNGNQIRCYNYRGLGHLARNCIARPKRRDVAYLQTQLLIAQKEEAGIQLQAKEFDFMAAAGDLDEIEEVDANCILMANLQQASTSEKQYTDLLEAILEQHLVQQNDSNVISDVPCVEQNGGTVKHCPASDEETRALYDSLYNNLAIEVEKVNSVNRNLKASNAELTTELARYKNQEKCFKISQDKYDKLERCYQQSVYQEQYLTKKINALHLSSGKQITALNEEISNLNKQLSMEKSTVSSLLEEKKKLKSDFKIREDELLDKQILLENKIKELDNILVKTGQSIQTMHILSQAAKFVRDFKSLVNEADESLDKQETLEREIDRLLRAVDTEYAKLWNEWHKKCEECKYDKTSYDKAYNDMHQKIKRLQAQLGDLKENENVELEFQVVNYVREIEHLKTIYKHLFDSISVTRAQTKSIIDSLQDKLHDTNYENAKLRAQLFDKVCEQKDTIKGTSMNTLFAKQSILGKPPSSSSKFNLYSVTPFPKSSVLPKVDKTNALSKPVTSNLIPTPQESKVVKDVKVITPGMFRINPSKTSREDKFVPINKLRASVRTNPTTVSNLCQSLRKEVNSGLNVYLLQDVNYTAQRPGMALALGAILKIDRVASVSKDKKQQKPKVWKPKNVGSKERLASPKPRKPSSYLRWSPTGRIFDLTGKIIESSNVESYSDYSNGDNAYSGCSKHMTRNLKLLINFAWKFLGTVRFGNDHVAAILGFSDLQWENILITRVYFVEGLEHNLFLVGQFYDSDLEVAFRRNTCFVRNLEGVDLLKGNRTTNLYSINLHDMVSNLPHGSCYIYKVVVMASTFIPP
ncbi:hypothetical protein Tco_0886188 [Tanacetum coccineum]